MPYEIDELVTQKQQNLVLFQYLGRVYLKEFWALFVSVLVARLAIHSQELIVYMPSVNYTLHDLLFELLEIHGICLVE